MTFIQRRLNVDATSCARCLGVALNTHITLVRNLRKKTIYNTVGINIKYCASLPQVLLLKKRICSPWEQILFFKSSPYYGSDSRLSVFFFFSRFFLGVRKINSVLAMPLPLRWYTVNSHARLCRDMLVWIFSDLI